MLSVYIMFVAICLLEVEYIMFVIIIILRLNFENEKSNASCMHNIFPTAPTYDLLVGNGDHLSLVHFEGTVSETVRSDTTGNVVGVDIHVE